MKLLSFIAFLAIATNFIVPKEASAQTSEEQFQDIFITAGYAAAFGASLGAASLAFYKYPEDHLKDIAVGASLGFIGGSLFGTYVVLSPVMASSKNESIDLLASNQRGRSGLLISPILNRESNELEGLGAGLSLKFN